MHRRIRRGLTVTVLLLDMMAVLLLWAHDRLKPGLDCACRRATHTVIFIRQLDVYERAHLHHISRALPSRRRHKVRASRGMAFRRQPRADVLLTKEVPMLSRLLRSRQQCALLS